jgi:parallel beta helix pectate lyase-like protein
MSTLNCHLHYFVGLAGLRPLVLVFFTMIPVLGHGATYYVAKTGSNSNTCAQSQSVDTSKLTIAAGLACLSTSDTLIIKAGTYTEGIAGSAIPSGTSDSARTIIRAATGETVVINGANSLGYTVQITNKSYITLDGLIMDGLNASDNRAVLAMGTSGSSTDPGAHFITVQNGTVRGPSSPRAVETIETLGYPSGRSSNLVFSNLDVSNSGNSSLYHGFYLNSRDSTIEDCKIHHNFGHGIQLFSSDGTMNVNNIIVRRNRIYNNGSFGLGMYSGQNQTAYANVIYENGWNLGSGGVRLGFGTPKFYNNILYRNGPGAAVWVGQLQSGSGALIKNNIFKDSGGAPIQIDSGSSGTMVQFNDFHGNGNGNAISNSGTNSTISNNITADPLFVSAASGDFHLQLTSPAIDAGVMLSEVATDFDRNGLPQGLSYDIGAFEYVSGQPSPPTNLRLVAEQ